MKLLPFHNSNDLEVQYNLSGDLAMVSLYVRVCYYKTKLSKSITTFIDLLTSVGQVENWFGLFLVVSLHAVVSLHLGK